MLTALQCWQAQHAIYWTQLHALYPLMYGARRSQGKERVKLLILRYV